MSSTLCSWGSTTEGTCRAKLRPASSQACPVVAVGAIKKKPAVIETPQGDLIGVRHFMFLSHSYDHRVVDGSLGGMFVRKVADYLEQFDPNTAI